MRNPECDLCNCEAEDSMDFETGNNAEYSVTVDLCADHLKEQEETGYAFEEKHRAKFESMLYERWAR